MIVVSNASPLVNLGRIGQLGLLAQLFGELLVPEAVWHEVVVQGRGQPGAHEVETANWVRVAPVANRALVLALRHPGQFRSVSAFSPICSPTRCPWGNKAFTAYLGDDHEVWKVHDACELIGLTETVPELLVDQGEADNFLNEQLNPDLLEAACAERGTTLNLRRHGGYDHSYYFVSTFIADHLEWHAERLGG